MEPRIDPSGSPTLCWMGPRRCLANKQQTAPGAGGQREQAGRRPITAGLGIQAKIWVPAPKVESKKGDVAEGEFPITGLFLSDSATQPNLDYSKCF